MFTGIIKGIGKVVKYDRASVWIYTPFRAIELGESISVDGVCLTASAKKGSSVRFDIGPATRHATTLGRMHVGRAVNLERALRIGDRLGGHWVTGHIEGKGRIVSIRRSGSSRWLELKAPRSLSRYILRKGSLAVDGVSLTVARCRGTQVTIML